jgi:ABC-type multidrug transport system fused ATPase/permease subunit
MENYKRVLGYLRPYRVRVVLSVLLMFLVTLSAIPMPLIQKEVIDTAIPEKDTQKLIWLFVAILGIYGLRGIVSYSLNFSIAWLGQRVVFDLRFQLYRHLQRLSMGFYDGQQPGKIMARLTGDIDAIQYALTSGVVLLITDVATLFIVTAWLFKLEWRLALIAIAILPLYVLNYKLLLKKIRETSIDLREKWERMLTTLTEKIGSIDVVKAFAHEKHEISRFRETEKDRFTVSMRQTQLNRILGSSSGFIRMVGTATILWYGGERVLGRQLKPGELLAFYSYLGSLYDPAVRVVDFNVQLQWASAAIDRVFETLDTRADIVDAPDAVHLNTVKGQVSFENMTFGYDKENPVLQNINFTVEPGQMIALVGPSGAGKSTLVNLLARFYDVTQGKIKIDGHDLRKIRMETLRRHIGFVSQETILFSVSLKENIRYGRKEASDSEVIAAAKAADLHEFITELPDSYDTKIGEDGIKLSGGQKQRMSIARALLADPRILILDDATSALDSHTESHVQAALSELMKGRTSFVIAHRLSTILSADKILVVSEGKIVDSGTHAELIARPGVYQDLYNEQFKTVGDLTDDEKARLVALAA